MDTKKIKSMIYRSSILLVVLFGMFFYTKNKALDTIDPNKEALILQGLVQSIEYVHYNPKPIDDEFSKSVYDTYLKRLDISKRFFTQKDMDALSQFKTSIDDQVNARTFEFFNATLPIIDAGISKAKGYFNEIIEAPMDFDKAGDFQMDADKREFAKDDAALKEEWKGASPMM